MEEITGTTTMPLKQWEDMKHRVADLEKQVQEKTIVVTKYETHPVLGAIAFMCFIALVIYIRSFFP